jgi:sulfur-carrier protein
MAKHLKVTVLFFGATADEAATRSMTLELPTGAVSAVAFEKLLELYPGLQSHKLYYSVNQEYATGTEALKEGDDVAVFTAVSGG